MLYQPDQPFASEKLKLIFAGKPVAFKLIPQGGPTLLAKPYSLIAKRGLFATKHLWVTPHKEEERYAAGDWVLQAEGGAGLEEWTKQVLFGKAQKRRVNIQSTAVGRTYLTLGGDMYLPNT